MTNFYGEKRSWFWAFWYAAFLGGAIFWVVSDAMDGEYGWAVVGSLFVVFWGWQLIDEVSKPSGGGPMPEYAEGGDVLKKGVEPVETPEDDWLDRHIKDCVICKKLVGDDE